MIGLAGKGIHVHAAGAFHVTHVIDHVLRRIAQDIAGGLVLRAFGGAADFLRQVLRVLRDGRACAR